MKGFHFRLDPILTLRRHREETLQIKLAESQRALEHEMSVLQSIRDEIDRQIERSARRQTRGPLDLGMLQQESAYQVALERRQEEHLLRVEECRAKVAEDRTAVLVASREKKALETLRGARLLSFVREEAHKEQKGTEDVATTRYVRQQRVTAEA